jgi:hypothetical protein
MQTTTSDVYLIGPGQTPFDVLGRWPGPHLLPEATLSKNYSEYDSIVYFRTALISDAASSSEV